MDAHQYLIPLAVAFGVAALMTPLVMRIAIAIGITDHPSERSVSHRPNIPLIGGIAVALGFAVGLAVAIFQTGVDIPSGQLRALAGGGAFVLLAGVYDDRFGMNAWTKFTVQIIAAALAIASGFQIGHLTDPFSRETYELPTVLSWIITMVWIVTVTNALNLVDGLDGLAAGVGAIIAATLALIAAQAGEVLGACVGVALLGALLGFLPFNFAPAKIFLGDTGALFIGYELSLLALVGYRQLSLLTFVVPVLALAVPILDTALSIIRRLRSGSPIFNADRQHMHHRMLDSEGSQRSAVLQVYLLTAAFCLIALAFSKLEGYMAILFLAAVGVLTYRLVLNLDALSAEGGKPSSQERTSGVDEEGE
jgi:UDP-GlcNAc:undecaprenyl-phosphate GlcNAc-1-phosphate transferase